MTQVLEQLKLTKKTTVRELNADLMFTKQMSLQYLLEVPSRKNDPLTVGFVWGEFDMRMRLEPMLRVAIGWSAKDSMRRQFHDDTFRILPATLGPVPSRGERHDPNVIDGAPQWLTGTPLEKEMVTLRRNWAAFAPKLLELADKSRTSNIAAEHELDESVQDHEEAARTVAWQQALDELPVLEYLEGTGLLGRAQFFLVPDLIQGFTRGTMPARDMRPRTAD